MTIELFAAMAGGYVLALPALVAFVRWMAPSR